MNRLPLFSLRAALVALTFALAAIAQAADPVGHTPGEFSVDPTGAANYRIPIVVPPGIAGMQPDLALLYSSRAGNGQLGVGWSISGLSAITRCPKTKAQDGATYMDGVDFDAEDRLCLDGQHLLYADSTPTDDEYWGAIEFSTEIASFQKITGSVPNGALGHSYFTVKDKAGLTRYYGNTTETKVEVKGIANPPTMVWALQRIEDKYSNKIRFNYIESANGEHRPSEITWENSQGFQAGKVVFEYTDARPDKTSGYLPGGGLVALTQRLTTMKVYARNTLVRRYNLAYIPHPVSGLSHLASVTECNGAGECLRPTSFTWEDNAGGFNLYNTRMYYADFNSLRFGDMDGDGRTDKVYKKDGTIRIQYGGQFSGHVDTGIDISQSDFDNSVVLDYNGDGRQDLLVAQGGWRLMQASATTRTLAFTAIVANSYSMNNNHPKPFALDVDGDGKSELIARNGSDHLVVWMNGPSGFGGFSATPVDTGFTVDANTRILPFEYNGDGRPDLLVYYKDSICYSSCPTAVGILVNTGSGFTHAGSGPGTHNGDTREHLLVLDANGDGLSDVLVAQNLTNTIDKWYLYLNNGAGGFASTGVLPLTVHHATAAQSLDHDGDGKADLMFAHNGKWWIAYSTGTGFGTDAEAVDTTIDDGGSNRESAALADFDGDGNADLFRAYDDGSQWKMYWAAGVQNGQLRKVVDGLGIDTLVNYWALSEPFSANVVDGALYGDLYSKDVADDPLPPSLPAPEYRDFNGPIQVVREFWVRAAESAASGDAYVHTQYHYAGAKLNNWGRGLAGFRRILAVNGNLGTRTYNYHRLDHPYAGMVEVARQTTPPTAIVTPLQQPQNSGLSRCENPEGEPVHADGCEVAYLERYDVSVTAGKLVSLTTNTFDSVNLASPDFSKVEPDYQYPYAKVGKYPFVKTTEVKHHDFTQTGEPLFKREYTRLGYDVCGNATSSYSITDKNGSGETVGVDGHTVTSTSTYSDSTACLGRLTQAVVTHARPTYAGSANIAPTSVTRTSNFGYNAQGYLNQEVIQSTDGPTLTKNYGIDSVFGNRISEQVIGTGVDRTTSTTYDVNGQFVVAVENALDQRETRTWDYRFGVQTSVTGPNGLPTQWVYDDFGRKVEEIAPRETVTTEWAYNWCEPAGTCTRTESKYYVTATGSDGSSNVTEYDRAGRAILVSKWGIGNVPDGTGVAQSKRVLTETHYDRLGRAYATSLPYFAGATGKCWVFRSFDPLGRVVSEHKADAESDCNGTTPPAPGTPPTGYGHVTTTEYIGLITRASVPVNATTTRRLERETNVMGRLRFIRELNATGTATLQWQKLDNNLADVETEYDYDPLGNTTWVEDANGKRTALGYNDRGFKVSMSDPDMGNWTYGYNALGELTTQTDAKSQSVTLQYDALGRLVQRTEPEGTTTWVYDTGYGAGIGKPAFVLAPDGFMEAYAYDEFGAVSDTMRVIGNELYWVSQVYDNLGRPHATVYPDIQAFSANSTPSTPAFASPPTTSTGTHTLNWNETSDYAVYRLYRHQATTPNSSLAVEVYTGASASFEDVVSANGNNHYWVKACHAELCSALSSVASVAVTLPPEPPAYVTVPDYDTNYDGSYSVNWGASPTSGVTYEAHEDTDIAPLFGSPSTIYTGAALTKARSNMSSGRYYYRVRACLGGNCSAWRVADASTLVERAPGNPGVPTIPAQNATTTFSVNWSAASGSPSRYEVYYSTWSGSCSYTNETLAASPAGASTSVTVPAFGNYCVRVRACRTSGQSDSVCSPLIAAASPDHTTAGPMPSAPGAMAVPASDGDGAYAVSWVASTGSLDTYELQEATNTGFTGATTTVIGWTETYYQCGIPNEPETCITPVAPATALNVSGKTNGTTYYYRVRACQPWGCTAWSTGANGALIAFPPGVPASITVPSTSTGSYTVSWGASTGTVTAYELYESTSSSFTTQTLVHSGTATSKALTKTASGTFYYRVRGCNSGQCSGYRTGGNSIVVTVSSAPSVPTLSTTTTFSTDGVYTISWTQSTGTVTAYELQQSIDGGAWAAAYTGTALSKAYSKGFGTWEFSYRVRACNGANCSAYSNVVAVYVEHCGGSGCVYVLPPRPALDEPELDRLASVPATPDSRSVEANANPRSELVKVSGTEIEGFRLMPPPRPADLARAVAETPVGEASVPTSPSYHVGITPQPVPVTRPKPVKPLRQHPLLIAKYLERGGRLPFKATKMAIGGGPSGTYAHKVMYAYNDEGLMHVVGECTGTSECAMGTVYWRAQAADAAGRVIQERVGDVAVTTKGFDEATGTLQYVDTFKVAGMVPLQDLDFTWDLAGNLLTRSEDLSNTVTGVNTRTEAFTYDAMLQLATSQVTDNGVQQTLYSHSHDPVGNLKIRAEATGYQYSATKPHAVTQYTKASVNYGFTYDLNGNVLTKTQGATTLRQACWQSSNHPTLIAAGTVTSCATGTVSSGVAWNKFSYAPDRSRYQQQTGTGGTTSTTTVYVGGLFEKTTSGTSTDYLHYIRGSGGVVATFNRNITGGTTTDTTEYWHRDHLGNVVFRTNASGNVVTGSRVQYDAWGKQLTGTLAKRNRGYTGHEHLSSLGLIHMNGRVYDPEVGRFLSPDTFVQFPESTQGFNRYAYVGNNPLSANDPSGHWIQAVLIAYSTVRGYQQGGLRGAVTGFALAGASAGIANGIGSYYQGVAVANGAAALAAGAATTAAPFLTVGQFIAKAALHGLSQGALSAAGGGRFGDGFLGGFAGGLTEAWNLPKGPIGVMVAAVIGGTVSKIGGGNFGNGAITAAFVQAFNNNDHPGYEIKDSNSPEARAAQEARRNLSVSREVYNRAINDCNDTVLADMQAKGLIDAETAKKLAQANDTVKWMKANADVMTKNYEMAMAAANQGDYVYAGASSADLGASNGHVNTGLPGDAVSTYRNSPLGMPASNRSMNGAASAYFGTKPAHYAFGSTRPTYYIFRNPNVVPSALGGN